MKISYMALEYIYIYYSTAYSMKNEGLENNWMQEVKNVFLLVVLFVYCVKKSICAHSYINIFPFAYFLCQG